MLSFHILSGAAEPVLALSRVVTILKLLVYFVLGWWVRVEGSCGELRFADCDFDVVVGGFVASVSNDTIYITSSASVDIIFAGYKASVARQILLVILEGVSRHYFRLLINYIKFKMGFWGFGEIGRAHV
jgi:hypothetical protein